MAGYKPSCKLERKFPKQSTSKGRKSPKEIVEEQRKGKKQPEGPPSGRFKSQPEGPPSGRPKRQPEGPPSQNRKYGTKGSEYRPGMRLKPKGIEVPAVEESLMDTDDLG